MLTKKGCASPETALGYHRARELPSPWRADHGNQLLTATEVGDEGFTASMAPCRRDPEADDVQMASGKG